MNDRKTVLRAHSEKMSRLSFLASSASLLVQSPVLISNAVTDEISDATAPNSEQSESDATATESKESETLATTTRTLEGCPKAISGKPTNCVATADIKQLTTYVPPWSFTVSPEDAFARLKGLVAEDPTFKVVECDESSLYLKVEIKRNFNTDDIMEFLVKRDDKVVLLKSSEKEKDSGFLSDFGANRNRIVNLHNKSSGVFRAMGEGLTADSYDGGAGGKRNGALGQLKAFYGLQSGEGYQEIFEE